MVLYDPHQILHPSLVPAVLVEVSIGEDNASSGTCRAYLDFLSARRSKQHFDIGATTTLDLHLPHILLDPVRVIELLYIRYPGIELTYDELRGFLACATISIIDRALLRSSWLIDPEVSTQAII